MRRRVGTAVLVAGLLALVGACGDDDDDDGGGDATTSITASATEFAFEPDTWTVPVDEAFDVDFTNEGTVDHEWAVLRLGEDIAAESEFSEDKVLFEIEAIAAGESTTEQFTVEEPGSYQVICAIPSHFDLGMQGTLSVG